MLMKDKILEMIISAVQSAGITVGEDQKSKITVSVAESRLGDYATNAALILAKNADLKPMDLARTLAEKLKSHEFEKVEVAAPGFINFTLKNDYLVEHVARNMEHVTKERVLVEYFQPNIAKPLHIGHLRTAIIGDAILRMLRYLGYQVQSDTHMGDWGTQFGLILLAYKKYGNEGLLENDPIGELNKLYVKINEEAEADPKLREEAKQEFVKLEHGDTQNHALWTKFVDLSMKKFLTINELMNIEPFDNHWPESFYHDKMPKVLMDLKSKNLLKESQGAQIVDLEPEGLGIGLIVKSDRGTTYLLRDLATFIFRQSQGFTKQLYVVDVRQSHAFKQLFAILHKLGYMKDDEGVHVDYGFMSFKGQALSTRKGNMVLVEEVLAAAKEKVAKIIADKNPELAKAKDVVNAVAIGAIKYFDLSHNRHSDIEFDWDKALDFEGNSGPYIQYSYARLASILRKVGPTSYVLHSTSLTPTEREILFKISTFDEVVVDAMKEYMPNVLANYLYDLAGLINKFYHESPVIAEPDEQIKNSRLALINLSKNTLSKGLQLLGIDPLEEM